MIHRTELIKAKIAAFNAAASLRELASKCDRIGRYDKAKEARGAAELCRQWGQSLAEEAEA